MENKVLEKNIAHIEAYDSELANKILRFKNEKTNIILAQSENEEYNLFFENELLHDPVNPTLEAKNIVQKISNKENENAITIIYGLGLGYLPDEVAREIKKSKIIVYEPNIEIINYVLSIAQIDALFQSNVLLCSNKEQLQKLVKDFCNGETKISISFLNSYKKLYLEDIKKTLEIAQKIQGEIIANKNTIVRKSYRALLNMLWNLRKVLLQNVDIVQLKDVYKGKTALILCAGPSLEQNIDCVIENRDKVVIFALNPTLKLLAQKGLKPDFVVDIETINNLNQFEDIDLSESCLIAEPFIFPLVMRIKTKKVFNYISEKNFLNSWLRKCLDIEEKLMTYGSVSSTAFYSALLMGFQRIIFLGQDLAYSNGKCYAKGAQFEHLECVFDENEQKYKIVASNFEKFVEKLNVDKKTFEKARNDALVIIENLNNNVCTVLSQDGKLIPTQCGYAFFVDIFSKIAKETKEKYPNIELINSSVGGAQIDGLENMPFSQVVKNLSNIEKIDFKDYKSNYNVQKAINEFSKMRENFKRFFNMVQKLYDVNHQLITELKNKKIVTVKAQKYLQKHKFLLNEIEKLKYVYDFEMVLIAFFTPMIPYVINYEIKDVNLAIENLKKLNELLYTRILKDEKAYYSSLTYS